MVNASCSSDPVDPLEAYTGIALFSQTFGSQPDHPLQSDPNNLASIHSHLKSMALRSPNKLLQQAKTILDSSSKLLNSEVTSDMPSKDNEEVGATNDNEIPRDRRPALGRKRARFSLKPNLSQSTASLEPVLDINQLKDPEEFFMAYERHENAKREIKKQMGGISIDSDQQNSFVSPRQRRPGISGLNRRPVKYKHYHSSVLSENNEAPISSQVTFEQGVVSPSQSLQQGISDELEGPITKAENRANGLLDELLSSCVDLDGDGAEALLQEHLQLKPIVLEKLSLPDLQNTRRNDSKALYGNSPKPRKVLVDMQNLLGGLSSKLPVKYMQETEKLVQNIGSPTPPKSPFASLSLLRKRALQQSDPSSDQYSFPIIDASLISNSSPVDHIEKEAALVDAGKDLDNPSELKLLIIDEDGTKACSPKVTAGDSPNGIGKSVNDDSRRIDFGNDFGSDGSPVDFEGHIGGGDINARVVDENLSLPDADVDVPTDNVSGIQENVGDMLPEVASSQPDLNRDSLTMEEPNSTAPHLDQSSLAAAEDHAIAGPSESADIGREPQLESQEPSGVSQNEQRKSKLHPRKERKRKHPSQKQDLAGASIPFEQESQEASRGSLNEQTKAKSSPRKERKRKEFSKRQSLAGAGTTWNGGVRRSTRIRTRPLEYWKGERLLYGRIHDSLSTVIGMIYTSPAKGDGKPTIKVKAFVPDKYKELVELAALH